jgi:glycosyltransferase involved in cell wall biosynthesis
MNSLHDIKVALVCDWLVGIGGAERVVEALHEIFPEAPIYTSQYSPQATQWLGKADIRTGWLQKIPIKWRKFLPVLRAIYFSRLDLSDYDLVVSCSGAEAKAVRTGSALHVCYCHAPTHYYWIRYDEYLSSPGFGHANWLARVGLKLLVGPMRRFDKKAATRPDYIIANSNFSQTQIMKYYQRESVVIHPPVDVERFAATDNQTRHGFVVAGRQIPYKKIDLAIAACNKLKLPLTVIGNGPEHDRLTEQAGPTIRFITDASDSDIARYFCSSEAFIFPTNLEDFGIVAVEALAAGTPVIAYHGGGPLDYITDGKTGLFFSPLSVKGLSQALRSFPTQKFNHHVIAESARQFSVDSFKKKTTELLQSFILSSDKIHKGRS